jgi:hypothetical protein
MKNIISILIIVVLLVLPFQSVYASGNTIASEKIKFCTTISNISKGVMVLRQYGVSEDDAMIFAIMKMNDLGMNGVEEAQDMAKLFVSTAYSFPIAKPPTNKKLVSIMGNVVMDDCIEELVEEKDFL